MVFFIPDFRSLPPEVQGLLGQLGPSQLTGYQIGGTVSCRLVLGRHSQTRWDTSLAARITYFSGHCSTRFLNVSFVPEISYTTLIVLSIRSNLNFSFGSDQ